MSSFLLEKALSKDDIEVLQERVEGRIAAGLGEGAHIDASDTPSLGNEGRTMKVVQSGEFLKCIDSAVDYNNLKSRIRLHLNSSVLSK